MRARSCILFSVAVLTATTMAFDSARAETSRQKPVSAQGGQQPVPVPVFLVEGQNFAGQLAVALRAPNGVSGIVYTLDGSDPTASSTRYLAPIDIARTTTLKARSLGPGDTPVLSAVVSHRYTCIRVKAVQEIRINFQPADAPKPMGYLLDTGQSFRLLEGGTGFGWSGDNTAATRQRNRHPDPLDDTLIYFTNDLVWELGVRNGTYQLTLGIGDATEACRNQVVFAEGKPCFQGINLEAGEFKVFSKRVTVTDGLLTLNSRRASPGPGATRMCWLDLRPSRQ